MNHRSLCLRIPTSSEISSPSKQKLTQKLDHSHSLSKPTSPKAKDHSFQNISETKKSAFHRITDPKSLKLISLPKFMTTSIELSKSLSPKSKKSNFLVSSSVECFTDSSSFRQEQLRCSNQVFERSDFVSSIKSTLEPNEVIFNFHSKELTRRQLQCLVRNCEVECKFIDTCLLMFEVMNRKRFQNNEAFDRVAMIQTDFSREIIMGESGYHFPNIRNLLKYEFIILPVFFKTWMLVVVDTRHINMKIFGLRVNNETALLVNQKIKEFVAYGLKVFENKIFEMTNWTNLAYKVVEMGNINDFDTGIEVLRQAFLIAANPSQDLAAKSIQDFKSYLLKLLFKKGCKGVA